ncbi:MAG: hypothetical protein HUJ93_01545, partial [Bacteroidales bacterium]|nr:hypothetical protein [Bacteroidales bacterium]
MFRKPSDLKPLPVSTQEFSEIREDGLFYVDKTDLVWQMATGRIDLVCRYDTCILVIELKMTDNGGLEVAEQQIADRDYIAPYM